MESQRRKNSERLNDKTRKKKNHEMEKKNESNMNYATEINRKKKGEKKQR